MSGINAAGTVPWRRRSGVLDVALVHRPKYDDWSWSKGKLDPGETFQVAATRETLEETGLHVRLGMPLPPTAYRVLDSHGRPTVKHVHYWAASVTGGLGSLENEIDEVAWLDPVAAYDRLDYSHDREQLRAIVQADARGILESRPVIVVRHGRAVPRSAWKTGRPDPERPLNAEGERQAEVIADILRTYDVAALVSSPSERCVATLIPYAARTGIPIRTRMGLSEEGFAARGAGRVDKAMRDLFGAGRPIAVCGHGPVLPTMIGSLVSRVHPELETAEGTETVLLDAQSGNLDKGESLVCHVVGAGDSARVVATERIVT